MTSHEVTQLDLFDIEAERVRQPAYVRYWYHYYLRLMSDDRFTAQEQQMAYDEVGDARLPDAREDRGDRLLPRGHGVDV